MKSLYTTGGLPFWDEAEILARDVAISMLALAVRESLCSVNNAWVFRRVEGPLITPTSHIQAQYTGDDIFMLEASIAGRLHALRPETTGSSYAIARQLLKAGEIKPPLCIWQAGKSFRRETNDGASPSKMRFNEFYQLEFQCIYRKNTKADYRAAVTDKAAKIVSKLTGRPTRLCDSDRLPSYSERTVDIECEVREGSWIEMASISTRTDFMDDFEVLELAFGLDRIVLAGGRA